MKYLDKELFELTVVEAAAGLEAKAFSSVDITEACLARIDAHNPTYNVFVTITPEIARQNAAESDKRRANNETRGELDGIPYTLKDVYATTDSPTSASSNMLAGWIAPYNSTVYEKLQAAGAVLLGKVNTDEFTMGVSTETSHIGVTRNPWDKTRVSGGSSGGPAAAVAACFGLFSVGTDTGGSIRQPASFCGVVGLRPTYGLVSRWGEIPMASSLDQTGPLTKTVEDAAIVLKALAGHDAHDANSSTSPVPDYRLATHAPNLQGLRIGIPQEYFGEGVEPAAEKLVREAIDELKKLGATIVDVSIPAALSALAAYYIIAPAEVSSNMARFDGIRYGHSSDAKKSLYDLYATNREEGLGSEVKRRIMLGTYVLSAGSYDAYYKQAEAARLLVTQQFEEVLKTVDVLAAPVSPAWAFTIGEKVNDPLAMYKEDILTVPVNISGTPGMSIPCGFVDGLPVGLQLIAAKFQEENIFKAGAVYQSVTTFHQQYPKL